MNCRDCKDTGFYQPLIGPREKCQTCLPYDTFPITVRFAAVYHMGPPLCYKPPLADSLVVLGLQVPLQVFYEKGRYCIIDGKHRFAALCHIRKVLPSVFERICPNNTVLVQTHVKQ